MKIRLFTFLCTVLLIAGPVACKKSEKEEKTTADNTTATTTPEMAPEKTKTTAPEPVKVEKPAVEKKTEELTINGAELSVDKKTGRYSYCTNCRRRSSKYYYYTFDRAEYEKVVGAANLKKQIKIQVEILSKSNTSSKPKDPNAPQPDGGFNHYYHTCKVVKLISAE